MKKMIIALTAAVGVATAQAQVGANENIFRYNVGDYEVILLSDGQGKGDARILIDAPAEVLAECMPDGTYPNATNAFLIKTPKETILVDAGLGRKLSENLEAVGVAPNDVDRILLTHMHGDHIGGLMQGGKKAFENAPLVLSRLEAEYWATQEGGAKNVLDSYAPQRATPYRLGEEPSTDGVWMIEAYGHTPGHVGFMVVSRNEKLLIWGDITHAMAVQMPHPEISVTYDTDPAMARQSRMNILCYAAERDIPVAGMHVASPAIGTVERNGNGFKFIPAKR